MNCNQCGSPLTGEDQFCKNCGAPVSAPQTMPVQGEVMAQPTSPVMTETPTMQNQEVMGTNMTSQMVQEPVQNMAQPTTMNVQPTPTPAAPVMMPNQAPNTQPVMQEQKSSGAGKIILLVVICVVALAIGLFVGKSFGSKNTKTTTGTGTATTNTPVAQTSKAYKVDFKGFTFTIPGDYIYENKDSYLAIGDEAGTWVAQLEVEQGNYSQLKANKNNLPMALQSSGWTAALPQEKTYSGLEFLTMEATYGGTKAILGVTKINAMNFAAVTTYNKDNEYDYKILEVIAPIIASAETTNASNSIATHDALDTNGLAELAK